MSAYEKVLAKFKEEMDEMGINYHEPLFHAICDHLGPSIHQADASLVACSDPAERKTIKTNFLMGKLGLEDGPKLDAVIDEVCGHLGQSNRQKHRPTFYYLLVATLHMESHFIDVT
jgi:hypothetical protein